MSTEITEIDPERHKEFKGEQFTVMLDIEGELEDSLKNRVNQTMEFGSVTEALYANFITTENIMEYLLDNPNPTDCLGKAKLVKLLAYRAVCLLDNEQIVRGRHFLSQTDDELYVGIFAMTYCVGDSTKSSYSLTKSDMGVKRKIDNILFKIYHEELPDFLYYICDVNVEEMDFSEQVMFSIADARSTKYQAKYWEFLIDHPFPFVQADYLAPLQYMDSDEYDEYLINRAIMLWKKAPLYWEYVVKSLYRGCLKTYVDIERPSQEKHVIEFYEFLFPGLFKQEILKLSDLSLRLRSLPLMWSEYILGVPVHLWSASRLQIDNTISLIDADLEKFLEQKSKDNESFILSQLEFLGEYKLVNQKDSLLESVWDYNLADVVYYVDKNCEIPHVFMFTKPEFDTLLKDKKNFYNKSPLTGNFLKELTYREGITSILPDCCIIRDLIRKVENQERLYTPKKSKNSDPPPPPNSPGNRIPEIEAHVIPENQIGEMSFQELLDNGGVAVKVEHRETGREETLVLVGLDAIPEEHEAEAIRDILDEQGYRLIARSVRSDNPEDRICMYPNCSNCVNPMTSSDMEEESDEYTLESMSL